MPLDFTDEKSTLVQVMAWCRQATSHYLSQCWPRSMSPNGVTRPQWVNMAASRKAVDDNIVIIDGLEPNWLSQGCPSFLLQHFWKVTDTERQMGLWCQFPDTRQLVWFTIQAPEVNTASGQTFHSRIVTYCVCVYFSKQTFSWYISKLRVYTSVFWISNDKSFCFCFYSEQFVWSACSCAFHHLLSTACDLWVMT